MPLRVLDLFCGGGGLSEGLRQAGFEVVEGYDKDKWSVATFEKNHLGSKGHQADLRTMDYSEMLHYDMVVGGPPCVQFSSSKSNKTRNVLDGLELVQSFLRAVHTIKPRYWIMENVPRVANYLPDHIPLRWFGVDEDGYLDIPNRGHFTAADFGAPQLRTRYLLGNFPDPKPTHSDCSNTGDLFSNQKIIPWLHFGDVLKTLPSPYKRTGRDVIDLNYGFLLRENDLHDHFFDASLNANEARGIKSAKLSHPFYGSLPFPDPLDRPARTVVATQLGRETLVIEEKQEARQWFRRATIRECGVLQTFPITYQFFGNQNVRYRLVGDAVPPVLSFAIGQEIRQQEGMSKLPAPIVQDYVLEPSPTLPPKLISRRRKSTKIRRFCEMVPSKEQRGCRIEFRNVASDTLQVQWSTVLYVGEGAKNLKKCDIYANEIYSELNLDTPMHIRRTINQVIESFSAWLDSKKYTKEEIQECWNLDKERGPFEIIESILLHTDQFFPSDTFKKIKVGPHGNIDISPPKGIRIRILIGGLLAAISAESLNQDIPSKTFIANLESQRAKKVDPKEDNTIPRNILMSA